MKRGWPGLVVVVMVGCGSPTSPSPGSIRPGLYVLAGQPWVTARWEYGDTLVRLSAIDFDSVRIVDDTLYERHYALSDYWERPGGVLELLGTGREVSGPGVLVRRDAHILLLNHPFFVPPLSPDHDVFSPGPAGLLRRMLIGRNVCDPATCSTVSSRFIDAVYTRR